MRIIVVPKNESNDDEFLNKAYELLNMPLN